MKWERFNRKIWQVKLQILLIFIKATTQTWKNYKNYCITNQNSKTVSILLKFGWLKIAFNRMIFNNILWILSWYHYVNWHLLAFLCENINVLEIWKLMGVILECHCMSNGIIRISKLKFLRILYVLILSISINFQWHGIYVLIANNFVT